MGTHPPRKCVLELGRNYQRSKVENHQDTTTRRREGEKWQVAGGKLKVKLKANGNQGFWFALDHP